MRKIGKHVIFGLLLSGLLCAQDKVIRLYMQDTNHNPIRQAEKAVPFVLQVVVDNMQGVQQPSHIPGFENFSVTNYGSSQSTQIINGKRTDRIMFNYVLRAEKTGTFAVGPLSIKDQDGKMITSERLQIPIGESTIVHAVKKHPYFLETQLSKKQLYIGEELVVAIRFYYVNECEDLKIVTQKFENFATQEVSQEQRTGTETIQGGQYHYQEWLLRVYPEKTGTLIIPPLQAVFRASSDSSHGLMGLFDIFGMSSEKVVQSTARSVDVIPLPESKTYKNVSAVGQFDKAVFALNKNEGDVGEGIVATCKIVGTGNFAMMKAPVLKLPAGLKYYDGNSSVQTLDSGKQEKTFEYIIQADKPGEFKIVSQNVVYFDAMKKSYQTLQTHGASLKIMGDVVASKNDSVNGNVGAFNQVRDMNQKFVFKDGQIDYVLEYNSAQTTDNNGLLAILSWLLVVLGCLCLCALLYGLYHAYIGVSWYETYVGYKLFVLWQLYNIEKKQDVYGLYVLMQQICKHYKVEFSEKDLVDIFQRSKMSDENIEEWKKFMQNLLVVVFAKEASGQMAHVGISQKSGFEKSTQLEKERILQRGNYWIKELLRCCHNIEKDHKNRLSS